MAFDYDLVEGWYAANSAKGFDFLLRFAPEKRILLASDGSLTLGLEALFGANIAVRVKRNTTSWLRSDTASYLDETIGLPALEREVWLMANDTRLVFAHSLIPKNRLGDWLGKALEQGADPLGKVLELKKIPIIKEMLEIGAIRSGEVCVELGIALETILVARRYRMFNRKDNNEWLIKAQITEVFSPELIAYPKVPRS
ncbi:MAG: chorismate lyase [Deltaproteobacteria bacterium]|nr:chorismate lyase [Deltaproteobacteria bacterium]